MTTIERALLDRLWKRAEECAPLECCGLLWSEADGQTISRFSAYPGPLFRHRFDLDCRWLLDECYRARRSGYRFGGYYHSHPETDQPLTLSEQDRAGHPPGARVLILGLKPRRFAFFSNFETISLALV